MKSKFQVKSGQCSLNNSAKPMWFVMARCEDGCLGYLHKDGTVYKSTYNKETSRYDGWFRTRADARMAIATAKLMETINKVM